MIWPGSAPIYVRRWPRISASSRMPPSDTRTNFRSSELAIDFGQRRLAHSRRAREAEDRPLHRRVELPHREVLENAVLRLLETGVIRVEHGLGARQIDHFVGALRPGQRDQPVEIGARDRVFGRRDRHLRQAIELALGFLLHARPACRRPRSSREALRFPWSDRRLRRVLSESPSSARAGSIRAGSSRLPTAPATESSSQARALRLP